MPDKYRCQVQQDFLVVSPGTDPRRNVSRQDSTQDRLTQRHEDITAGQSHGTAASPAEMEKLRTTSNNTFIQSAQFRGDDVIFNQSMAESIDIVATEEDTVQEDGDFIQNMYPKESSSEFLEFAALGVLILWMTFFAFNCGTVESVAGKVKTIHSA